jgi:hypothetical protein
MRQPASSLGRRLRKVTLIVPENCAESLRDLARVLRARQAQRTGGAFEWRRISPSAAVMVDPQSGVRCAVRDTRVVGAERYQWTVTAVGTLDLIGTGRASDTAAARSRAEAAARTYSIDASEYLSKRNGSDG